LTNTQPYQSSSFNAGQSYGANIGHTGSFSSQLSPAIGPNPFAGETHDLAALMYNDQYQQLLIAQRVQYQQIQLLQAQIGANQMAAQQAQLQAQQSGSFVAPRFRALAEQRQAQQTQQQIAQLGQAQQVYEMQQQALMKVQEAHARAAAQEALKNPAPVFEEDEEEYNQQQQRKQQALLEQRQKAKEMNPAFNFGAKRQGTDDRQKASSMSPPMGNTVIVDRSQGIGGAQATGLAGLAARAHKRTGSELTPAMQQQVSR
jgi:protein SSD1